MSDQDQVVGLSGPLVQGPAYYKNAWNMYTLVSTIILGTATVGGAAIVGWAQRKTGMSLNDYYPLAAEGAYKASGAVLGAFGGLAKGAPLGAALGFFAGVASWISLQVVNKAVLFDNMGRAVVGGGVVSAALGAGVGLAAFKLAGASLVAASGIGLGVAAVSFAIAYGVNKASKTKSFDANKAFARAWYGTAGLVGVSSALIEARAGWHGRETIMTELATAGKNLFNYGCAAVNTIGPKLCTLAPALTP